MLAAKETECYHAGMPKDFFRLYLVSFSRWSGMVDLVFIAWATHVMYAETAIGCCAGECIKTSTPRQLFHLFRLFRLFVHC